MDDSKDGDTKELSVSESMVTVKTVVTTTETVIKKVVEGVESRERVGVSKKVEVEEDGGACEGGDVMVEISGSDVFLDGVRDELGGNLDAQNEDVGGSREKGDSTVWQDRVSGIREDDLGPCGSIGENSERTESSEESSSYTAEVKNGNFEDEAERSSSGVKLTVHGGKDVSTEGSVEAVKEKKAVDGSGEVPESRLGGEVISEEGDDEIVLEGSACHHSTQLRDGGVCLGNVEFVEAPIVTDMRTCVDTVQSSPTMSSLGPETVVAADQMEESCLPGRSDDAYVSCEPDLQKPAVTRPVNRDTEMADPECPELSDKPIQTNIGELAADSIVRNSAAVPDIQCTGVTIKESQPFVEDRKSIDGASAIEIGHGNGSVHKIKHDGMAMESDVMSGSPTHSKNQLVTLKKKDEHTEKSAALLTFLNAAMETDIEIYINAADANPEKHSLATAEYEFQSNSKNQLTEVLADSVQPTDLGASTLMDKQDVVSENKMQNIDEELKRDSPVLEHNVSHISGSDNPMADSFTGSMRESNRVTEGNTANGQLLDESAPENLELVSDTSLIGCVDNSADDGLAQFGSNMGVQGDRETVHGKLLASVDNASSDGHKAANLLEHATLDARIVQAAPDDASCKEDEITKLSVQTASVSDRTQVVSNAKDIEEVQDESTNLPDLVASGADTVAHPESNVDDIGEMKEDLANAEVVFSVGNADLEENTAKLPNQVLSTDGEREMCMMDVDYSVGPFIVETEGPDESISGSADADEDSSPIYDGNVGSIDQSSDEQPPSPVHRLVGQGAVNHVEDESVIDAEQVNSPKEQEAQVEQVSHSAKPPIKEARSSRRGYSKVESLSKDHRVSYQLPPDMDGEFSVFDLVWGKVKSHPWWPGQIFHPSDSSEKAMKYFRKDCYLVAYFGDRTFAWNEASVLKPFRRHFPVAERQNKTEAFQNAVCCALEEVSRRTELGLACSCISEEASAKIRCQIVENAGIRDESSKREGVDRCTGVDFFHPGKFVEYTRSLAVFPTGGVDRLELVIAKAQLTAFHRLRGIEAVAEFQYFEGLSEPESDMHSERNDISSKIEQEGSFAKVDAKSTLKGPKRKHNLKDIVYQRRKEKSMTELMGEYYLDCEFDSHEEDDNMLTSPTSGMKRKAAGFFTDDFTSIPSTKTIALAKVSQTVSSNPQQSFKVGECIRRVASQLTGSPSTAKGGGDGSINKHFGGDGNEFVEASDDSQTEMSPSPSQQSSLEEMLSQLHLTARDPKKGYSFLSDIISFFSEFRVVAVSNQRQQMRRGPRKRKSSAPVVGPPETFEFDDRNDSYWADMVVQDTAEAKPSRRNRKRKSEQGATNLEKPPQSTPRKNSRKQYFHGNLGSAETSLTDEKPPGNFPTELILSFTEMSSIPSESNINKTFRRFGPLKESETKIDTQSSRARVVFKKRSDAEVAYSSAAMFNVFGSTVVSYHLNYVPSDPFTNVPLVLTEGQEIAS